ncbi:MAG TPA: DUF5916 domain-containing protein [bacterium]|jgi:hypothetical protein
MRLSLTVLLTFLTAAALSAEIIPPRELHAVRGHDLRIDGTLETAWLSGAVADSFVQKRPVEGAPATLPTRAYVMYDNDALYVAYLCLDTAPDSITSRVQRRDNTDRSDVVQLILDTFHDRRNAYVFTVTASGVQADGTMSNENIGDMAWDAIWQSAVGRTDSGWVAEIRIPFQSIRHGGVQADGWGINLVRYIDRRQESAFWQPVNRERGFRVSEMGYLKGLDHIASARHVEVLPHVVGRWDAQAPTSRYSSQNRWRNLGMDVKLVPGSAWTMDLAYRPDFAQVDVDDEIINLSDYPVYVSEKRPFFLESKELFDNAPVALFYTRRINDPVGGGKLNVQRENFRATVLAARDDATLYTGLRDAAAGRVVWNLGRVSAVGFTGTYLRDRGAYTGLHAAAGSLDARIRWHERDRLLLAVSGVDRSGGTSRPVQGSADLFHDFHFTTADVSFDYRGADFNINDLGWDSFSNYSQQRLWVGKDYYPKTSVFQYVGYDVSYRYRALTDNSHPETFLDYNLYATSRENIQFQAGSEFGNWQRRDYWAAVTPYRDNFGTFAPEYHPVATHWLWIASDQRKPVEAEVTATYGSLYEGHKWSLDPDVTVKVRENLDFMAAMSWQHVWDLQSPTMLELGLTKRNGDLNYDPRVWRLRARWSPTLNVSLRGTVQWREDAATVQTNLLLAWNWRSGSWFYVVYDEAGRPTYPLEFAQPGDRTLRLKWTYYFTVG